MGLKLVTIPNVPLVEVGDCLLQSGPKTFTEEDMVAAVEALKDPSVKKPRIGIDGLDALFDPEAHGGEPAFGHVENMRVSANGQALVGDLVVPEVLADNLEWAYPARSVEGAVGWESPQTKKRYELVITAVKLLGVDWPGSATLPDLAEVLMAQEGPAPAPMPVLARSRPGGSRRVEASLDQDLVRRRFYEQVEEGEVDLPDGVEGWALWIRSMRFDDDGKPYLKVENEDAGTLFRVDFKVSGAEVTFDGFTEVVEQDVPVAAATDAQRRQPLAVYASRAESRAVIATDDEQETTMRVNIARLRERLGLTVEQLPDDANDEQINSALELDEGEPGDDAATELSGGEKPAEEAAEEATPAQVAAAAKKMGLKLVDDAEWDATREGAQAGRDLAAKAAKKEKAETIAAAMGEGRFPPSRKEHWEKAWDEDAEGTKHLLTASPEDGGIAPGLVPVEARGSTPQEHDTAADPGYDVAWLPPHVQERIAAQQGQATDAPRARVIQEVG